MDTTYLSPHNTETHKYTGPLAVVRYEGERNSDSQMHGQGKVLFANGGTYEGEFRNDMLQGEGTMADPTGVQVYTGGWLADARCGYAVFTYEGGKYEGHYVNNKRHGEGKETTMGNTFQGLYQEGEFTSGRVCYSNGDIYVGQMRDDCRHGRGRFLSMEGVEQAGMWEEDVFVGV
ncbi:hypothetical protein B484DRAFT_397961 [Ochromonadaceae sp. CCMP2298]|nr:hypothetical protein B484DRAFT_397961 [Ochromonadaceae sp. CCMP2298]|eukprot:CAMPEP_0173174820 /NCGR_PEP_ID=MMETSP1141-20130122/3556_1 /TAXON_ID=483371 /ORGANISM="non described non described, Strain CCMP2298" /LENGTH=174 /DNA_ID=CAMNT_0014096969 /DNA_START=178 /DNA_END=702 /DNA_ORIENTATION=-